EPALLALLVDAADAIQQRLDRPQHRRQERTFAVEHARHVAAQDGRERDDDRAIKNDLDPTDDGHGMSLSLRAIFSESRVTPFGIMRVLRSVRDAEARR